MTSIVKDVMTTRVIWVRKDASFREMAAVLREHRVSAFPVLDEGGKVIGVVSEASGRATGARTCTTDRSGKIALPAAGRKLRHGARPRR